MIQHLAFNDLTEQHLTLLARSLLSAPADVRPDCSDILRCLLQGTLRAFVWDEGILVVGTEEKRLRIHCFAGTAFILSRLANDLKRLAADWECDTIETLVFDARLAHAIQKIGGRVESYTLTLAVED